MFNIISVVLSLILATATVIVPLWVRPFFTRLQLNYDYQNSIPFINEDFHFEGVTVMFGGSSVMDPHVVQFRISNPKRSDITSNKFDQGTPLRFDFKVNLIALVPDPYSERTDHPYPKIEITSNTELSIGPGRIPSRSVMKLMLLSDGPCTEVMPKSPLENVLIKREVEAKSGRGMGLKTISKWASFAFILWWVIQEPASAAHLVHAIGTYLSNIAHDLSNFLTAGPSLSPWRSISRSIWQASLRIGSFARTMFGSIAQASGTLPTAGRFKSW